MQSKFYSLLGLSTILSASLFFASPAQAQDYSSLSSKEVQIVQQALADSGFYRAGVDGLYGPDTFQAIRSYQFAKGLPVTGVLDDATLRALSPRLANSKQRPDPERVSQFIASERAGLNRDVVLLQRISPAAGTKGFDRQIDQMDRHSIINLSSPIDVATIQRSLQSDGFYQSSPVDGVWGPKTTSAVRKFQSSKGLSVTGTPTVETVNALGLDVQTRATKR